MSNNGYEPVGEIVSIFRRGDKWYANFQHAGRQHRKSLGTHSKKEARRQALLLEAELLNGRYRHQPTPPTVQSAVDSYLKHARTEQRAPRTLAKYEQVLQRALALANELGRKNLLGIDLKFVDEYRHRRVAAGRAPKTVYNETMILRQLVNFAVSRAELHSDPLKGLRIKEPKPNPQPCWTRAQVEQILAASSEPQRSAFMILAETGMRIGELCWLTWKDVDLERNVLHVRPKEGWKPKTGDQRAIPISPAIETLLAALPRHARWVLTARPSDKHPKGDGQISARRLLRSLKRVLEKLGLEGHLHTFRHSFISHALTSGIPTAIVQGWVGQVDDDVIKLYTHIIDADLQSAMRRLAEARNGFDDSQDKE